MRFYIRALFLAAVLLCPYSVHAASIEDTSSCLCALTKVIECSSQEECLEIAPEEAGLPTFIKINFAKQFLSGVGDDTRSTKIQHIIKNESQVVLQGFEGKRAWNTIIDYETGNLTSTISGKDHGFTLFGKCIPMP